MASVIVVHMTVQFTGVPVGDAETFFITRDFWDALCDRLVDVGLVNRAFTSPDCVDGCRMLYSKGQVSPANTDVGLTLADCLPHVFSILQDHGYVGRGDECILYDQLDAQLPEDLPQYYRDYNTLCGAVLQFIVDAGMRGVSCVGSVRTNGQSYREKLYVALAATAGNHDAEPVRHVDMFVVVNQSV